MKQEYYYIPISSLNFTNVLSSDSISPASFYAKRGYGFKRFEKTASNPFDNVILAYSSPVIEPPSKSGREEFLINLKIPSRWLKSAISNKSGSHEILCIKKSIHFHPFASELVFTSDQERKRIIATGLKSLEAKFISYYEHNSSIVADIEGNQIDWNEGLLESISDAKFDYSEIVRDQRFNKIKGVAYGLACGLVASGSPEISAAKQYIQEFNNEFSSVLNQLSTLGSGSKKGSTPMDKLRPRFDHLKSLESRIKTITKGYEEANEIEVISKVVNASKNEVEKWKTYRPNNGKSVFDVVLEYLENEYLELMPLDRILSVLREELLHLARYKSTADYQHIQELYSKIRHVLTSRVTNYSRLESDQNALDSIPLKVQSDYSVTKASMSNLSKLELNTVTVTLNQLINFPEVSSSDQIAQRRKEFIGELGQQLKSKDEKSFTKNGDLEFLRRLYKSIQTVGTGFRIDEGNNRVLKVLAAFFNKYSELEKYQDYLAKNKLGQLDVAYAIWGGAYGYANISKLLVEPLERSEFSARVVFEFIENVLQFNSGYSTTQGKNETPIVEEEQPTTVVEWDVNPPSNEPILDTKDQDNNTSLIDSFRSHFSEDKQLSKHPDWLDFSIKKLKAILITGRIQDNSESKVSDFQSELMKERPKGFGPKKVEQVVELFKQSLNE